MGVEVTDDSATGIAMELRAPEEPQAHKFGPEIQAVPPEITGAETFTWTSSDGRSSCEFGRARGIVSLTVARVLGPTQSGNGTLELYYKAVAGIKSWNGTPVPQPSNEMLFDAAFKRFPTDQDFMDFINTWQQALYPEATAAIVEAMAEGYGPEAIGRIVQNAGKSTTKK